jgi:hypothetical protein
MGNNRSKVKIMNCENCQNLLSEFLDESLDFAQRSEIEAHLQECVDCFSAHCELNSILDFCETHRGEYDSLPNPQALWLRISNLIESQNRTLSEKKREGFWNRLSNSTWQISLPQLITSMAGVAIIVALLTTIGLRGFWNTQNNNDSATATSYSTDIEERLRQKQQVIDYWNQRVEARKAEWDKKTRETFERSLAILDETVAQNKNALMQNPHDEVYREALDSAIDEKIELLKDFSEL